MNLPNDPIILLSFINTNLRDFYDSLDELCLAMDLDKDALIRKLKSIDYKYDAGQNRFV